MLPAQICLPGITLLRSAPCKCLPCKACTPGSSCGNSESQDSDQQEGVEQRSPDEQEEHEGEKGQKGSQDSCYEFSMTETTILEVVMDSMRTCGLALALQAITTVLLGMLQPNPALLSYADDCSLTASLNTKQYVLLDACILCSLHGPCPGKACSRVSATCACQAGSSSGILYCACVC